jgi:hypothetical protein
MQMRVTPEQRQSPRREIVGQVELGATTSDARIRSAVPMHRMTVYRLLKRAQSEGESAFADGVAWLGSALAPPLSSLTACLVSPSLVYCL